jgi:hypothetical protein
VTRALLLCLVLLGCGPAVPRTRGAFDAERLARARALGAEQRAPLLYEAAERALSDAAELTYPSARAELETEARLWLEAAITECERSDLNAERLVLERQIEESYRAAIRDTEAARALAEQTAVRATARAVREEAQRALERAATIPARRPKLAPADERRAAEALVERARLVLAAARAMGATPEVVQEAEVVLQRAQGLLEKAPDRALAQADAALSVALATLADVRKRSAAPSAAERRALAEEGVTAGALLSRDDRGLLLSIEGALDARGQLSFSGRRQLSRLCALAVAHPHGPVRLTLAAASDVRGRAAQASLARELPRLGCKGERFAVDVRSGARDGLELSFTAY